MVKPVEFGGVWRHLGSRDSRCSIGSCRSAWHAARSAFVDQHAGLAHAGGQPLRQPAAIEASPPRPAAISSSVRARSGWRISAASGRHAASTCRETRRAARDRPRAPRARQRRSGGSGGWPANPSRACSIAGAHSCRPRQRALRRVHRPDPAEQAGRRDAQRPAHRDAAGAEPFRRGGAWRATGGVAAPRTARPRDVDLDRTRRRPGRTSWLHHAERQRDRDRRISRIAAGAQHVEPGLGRHRMIGADRAMAAHDQRTMRAGGKIQMPYSFRPNG